MILWFDFEATDLDKRNCELLEFAAIATDDRIAADIAVYQTLICPVRDDWYTRMPPVVVEMHTESGLLADLAGNALPSVVEVEAEILVFIEESLERIGGVGSDGAPVPVGGTGIQQYDLQIIENRMPLLWERLSYKAYDVGAIRRFLADLTDVNTVHGTPPSRGHVSHRALPDVMSALDEARHFQHLAQMLVPEELRTL